MTIHDAKSYLNQLRRANFKIMAARDELARLKDMRSSLPSVDYARERVQGGKTVDRVAETAVKIVDLERRIEAETDEWTALYETIRARINELEDEKLRFLLLKHYLCLAKWDDVAEAMNYTKRHVMRLHICALEQIAETSF